MVGYLILQYVSNFFFLPLLGGLVILVTADIQSRIKRRTGWVLIVLGVSGAVVVAPLWHSQLAPMVAAANYIDQRCKATVVELPKSRLTADGVAIIHRGGDVGIGRVNAEWLVQPALGRFQRAQESRAFPGGANDIREWDWSTANIPSWASAKAHKIDALTMPYELVVESITTEDDKKHGVEGIEVKVREKATQSTIARKVAFAQWPMPSNSARPEPSKYCPQTVGDVCTSTLDCDLAGPFALKVLQPRIDSRIKLIFDVYRGMDNVRHDSCVRDIRVEPGITANDIEWWGEGMRGWEDLHLRVRGTSGEMTCHSFLWGGNTNRPAIRFGDGSMLPTEALAKAFISTPSAVPRPLVATRR